MMTELIRLVIVLGGGFIFLVFIIRGVCLIGPNEVGILTKNMFGKKCPQDK